MYVCLSIVKWKIYGPLRQAVMGEFFTRCDEPQMKTETQNEMKISGYY